MDRETNLEGYGMTLTDRLPPHDIEAEEAVVASVMVDAEAWG